MATLATTGPLGSTIKSAYGGYVQLSTGEVISCLEYQRRYDAAGVNDKPVIATVLPGAYSNNVLLEDGRIVPLGQFQKEVTEAADLASSPQMVRIVGRGYSASSVEGGETKSLAARYVKP